MGESKAPYGVSWQNLVKEQLRNQASSVVEDYGDKLWVIAQIGFYICIFRFDFHKYKDSNWFTNFSPLNLRSFTEKDLDELEIKYIAESNSNNQDIIRVIQWDLRDGYQHIYIHNMLEYIYINAP